MNGSGEHEHEWGSYPNGIYTTRRCKVCLVLARNSNGNMRILTCYVCQSPATRWQLGSGYCEKHELRPGGLRTLKDMSEEEISKLEAQYGVPVQRPSAPGAVILPFRTKAPEPSPKSKVAPRRGKGKGQRKQKG